MKFLFYFLFLFSLSACGGHQGPGDLIPAWDTSQDDDDYYDYPDTNFQVAWPIFGGKITQFFSMVNRKPHYGIDISAPKGTAIRAAHEGMVVYVGQSFRGYGKMILLESGDRWATLYSHLSRISVKQGQNVFKGQAIGLIGRSGNATGVHLHFEVRRDKQPVDPMKFLKTSNSLVTSR